MLVHNNIFKRKNHVRKKGIGFLAQLPQVSKPSFCMLHIEYVQCTCANAVPIQLGKKSFKKCGVPIVKIGVGPSKHGSEH
jgi:hypothetical protein